MRGGFQDRFGEPFGTTLGSILEAFGRPWEHFWHPGSNFGGFGGSKKWSEILGRFQGASDERERFEGLKEL